MTRKFPKSDQIIRGVERTIELQKSLTVVDPMGLGIEPQGAGSKLPCVSDIVSVGGGAAKGLFPVDKQVLPIIP